MNPPPLPTFPGGFKPKIDLPAWQAWTGFSVGVLLAYLFLPSFAWSFLPLVGHGLCWLGFSVLASVLRRQRRILQQLFSYLCVITMGVVGFFLAGLVIAVVKILKG